MCKVWTIKPINSFMLSVNWSYMYQWCPWRTSLTMPAQSTMSLPFIGQLSLVFRACHWQFSHMLAQQYNFILIHVLGEKKGPFSQLVREVEIVTFSPLALSITGGTGREATCNSPPCLPQSGTNPMPPPLIGSAAASHSPSFNPP